MAELGALQLPAGTGGMPWDTFARLAVLPRTGHEAARTTQTTMSFDSPEFWVALLHLIGLNCVLSADNAVTIALVARRLPVGRQIRAFAWGGAAALAMRIGLTLVAAELLRLPYLKLVGALLLLWIAVQLLRSEPASEPVSGDAESGPIPGFRPASAQIGRAHV